MCSARNNVVSKTLLVKVKGSISEEKLASDFCLQLPGWCPCLNCRDFVPSSQSIQSRTGSCNKNSEMIRLKRKAPEKFGEPSKKPYNEAEEKEDSENHIADRFQFDLCSVDELQKFEEGECSENTAKNNDWALRNFHAWRVARNEKHPDDQCPEDLFVDKRKACDWLCKFVCETRRSDGQKYMLRSLYLLLYGPQQCVRKLHPTEDLDFFRDPTFKPLKTFVMQCLNACM